MIVGFDDRVVMGDDDLAVAHEGDYGGASWQIDILDLAADNL